MAAGVKASKVCPKFLHSNSTSHTWVFSAIAELIDNSCDTDVSAQDLWIDTETINNTVCLTFLDNGFGMTREKLHGMLGFGYSEKEDVGKQLAIGRYGNGFKSGSMRIGQDAIVITRSIKTMSVGLLSQTYLKAIGADTVLVPVSTWDITPVGLTMKRTTENVDGMKAILRYSIFQSEGEIARQLDKLGTKPGTKIIIYNLRKDSSDNLELDFISDKEDIRNPETEAMDPLAIIARNRPAPTHTPEEYKRSLREYCSILYLRPRMRISIRGKKVANKLIEKSLKQTEEDVYSPQWANVRRGVKLTFGFTKDTSDDPPYGFMTYHKNRLIKAYEKIGIQKKTTGEGTGIIGVAEVNFLEPIHNKQEFKPTGHYQAFMSNAATKLKHYYEEKTQTESSGSQAMPETEETWDWVQCDNCMSYRRVSGNVDLSQLPDKWYCKDNPDPLYNRCEVPEELEREDEEKVQPKPTYTKTVQKKKAERKKLEKLEEERKGREKEEALQALKTAKEKEEEALKTAAIEAEQKEQALKAAREKEEALQQAREEASRNEETLRKQVEKQRKAIERQKEALEYINPDIAGEEKAKGNALFSQGNYTEALKHYKEAVRRNPKDAKLHSNRAACYTKLQAFSEALEACDECLAIDPKFIKGYLRRGNILKTLNKDKEASQAYEKALQINPDCTEAVQGFQYCQGGEHYEVQSEGKLIPSLDTSLENSEVSPGKRKYPDRNGDGDKVSRPRLSTDGNNKVTKQRTPVKAFPHPRTRVKSSPGSASKRDVATPGTNSSRSAPSSVGKHSAVHRKQTCTVTGDSLNSFINGDDSPLGANDTIPKTEYTEPHSSSIYNGTSSPNMGPASNNVPTVSVKISKLVRIETESETCRTALNFDNDNTNCNVDSAIDNVDVSVRPGQDNHDEPDIKNEYSEMEADNKPEEEDFDKMLTEMTQVIEDTRTVETEEKKVFQQTGSQTVPTVVKYASPNEVELLKLCPAEQRQMLLLKARELDELRRNVLTLMKMLQPDYDYGPPENVDNVIKEFITANTEENNGH